MSRAEIGKSSSFWMQGGRIFVDAALFARIAEMENTLMKVKKLNRQ